MQTNLANHVIDTIGQILNQDDVDDQEKRWMENHVGADQNLKALLGKLKTSEIHVIALIQKQANVHVKELPALTHLSQPTVSRMIKKLAEWSLITRFRAERNDKEIVVALTSNGTAIANVHRQLEQQLNQQAQAVLAQYPPVEVEHFVAMLKQLGKIKP